MHDQHASTRRLVCLLMASLCGCGPSGGGEPVLSVAPESTDVEEKDPAGLPAVDDAAFAELFSTLQPAPADQLSILTASGLGLVWRSARRLPKGMTDALEHIANAPVKTKEEMISAALRTMPDDWKHICPAGLKVLDELATVGADKRADHVWRACELASMKLLSAEDALATNPWHLATAHVIAGYLIRHGALEERERSLLWVMMTNQAYFRREDAARGFSVELPVSWELKPSPDGVLAVSWGTHSRSGPKDTFRDFVLVTTTKVLVPAPPGDLPKLSALGIELAGAKVLSTKTVEIAGHEGTVVRFETRAAGRAVEALLYNVDIGSKGYWVACVSEPSAIAAFEDSFHRIATSLRPLDP